MSLRPPASERLLSNELLDEGLKLEAARRPADGKTVDFEAANARYVAWLKKYGYLLIRQAYEGAP